MVTKLFLKKRQNNIIIIRWVFLQIHKLAERKPINYLYPHAFTPTTYSHSALCYSIAF